jgi:5'-phosphate synthase pdxT subunit
MFEALAVETIAVRLPAQLDRLDALVIPGGESTAIAKLMRTYGFYEGIRDRHRDGMAVWGTCAGAILVAREILDALPDQEPLDLIDVTVRRNAFGRQVDSFEADLDFAHLDDAPYRGVFIRAPWVETCGEDVEPLALHEGRVVAARQGDVLATVFHPELTGDVRVHRFFVEAVASGVRGS